MEKLPRLYHISFNKNLPLTLVPKQPDGSGEGEVGDSSLAEDLPPRVCFAPSVEKCFIAIYPNISHLFEEENNPHIDIYVYERKPESVAEKDYMTPEHLTSNKLVHDAHITDEYVFFKPVKVERIAKVRIHKPLSSKYYACYGNGKADSWYPADMKIEVLERYSSSSGISRRPFDEW